MTTNNSKLGRHPFLSITSSSRFDESEASNLPMTVLLELVVVDERELEMVRTLFPDAQESQEPFEVEQQFGLDRKPCREIIVTKPVLRTDFPTLDAAHDACRTLPTSVLKQFQVETLVDEEQLEALAEYHIRWFVFERPADDSDAKEYCYHSERHDYIEKIIGHERMQQIWEKTGRIELTLDQLQQQFDLEEDDDLADGHCDECDHASKAPKTRTVH